jgi:predicted nuclease of predicted toxin-antitoxin system
VGRQPELCVKFLLDEHLSPTLVSYIASLGCYGAAVPHVGLSGASDRAVWRYAYENDLTVITTNARDFLALLNVEVHPGLIVLRESGLSRQEQWERIEPVLRYLLARNDPNFMLNKVIEVEAPDRFSTRGVPAPFFP